MSRQLLGIRDKTVIEQFAALKKKFQNFEARIISGELLAKGPLQPTSRSCSYLVGIKYQLRKPPSVKIIHPALVKNFNGDEVPHLYPAERLCLYRPVYREFKYSDYIADTILPWTSLWLYYDELWHINGQWLGGGEHPGDSGNNGNNKQK